MRFNTQPYKNQSSRFQAAAFSPRGPALSFGDKRIDDVFNGGFNSHAMHEIYGPAAVGLTSMIASFTTGKIIWVRSKNQHKQLNPHGILYINNNGSSLTLYHKGPATYDVIINPFSPRNN